MDNIESAGLPQCELLSILNKKAERRIEKDINFSNVLTDFSQRVNEEVSQISALFPEYTPHNYLYHLRHLFIIADKILGKERLMCMNEAELFILAIGLYGHDWGMAVGTPEMKYITSGELIQGTQKGDLCILPDEPKKYQMFLKNECSDINGTSLAEEGKIDIWRKYVRKTHAFRSAERIRRYFEPINRSIAESAAKVCEGHLLDFEEIQNPSKYPSKFSAIGQVINLRAITVYVRLIDLLDLGEDRTPFILWKFIAPLDPKSKMEWEKHRALSAVTFPTYLEGRVVHIDGRTNDQSVYAELEDLRAYCDEQLRGCNNVLAQMNDPRHKLDLYHIDWNVETIGFKKISIRFEFDRDKMLRYFTEEIYQNDPYVFLRELLQNSIDAIRMRKELMQMQIGSKLTNFGEIQVSFSHDENGNITITWCDNGIGMDEYIVRNYLSQIGKSYYGSKDFKMVGVNMDPISRFGIGILSCFIVTDSIKIETLKDPYLQPKSPPLRIIISDKKRHFQVEESSADYFEKGTKVTIQINKNIKLKDSANEILFCSQNISKYLSTIAGFVEFPIIIRNEEQRSIIINPNQKPSFWNIDIDKSKVIQTNLNYPWSESILPQDMSNAKSALKEEKLDLATDLKLDGYEGVLSYLVPASDNIDLSYSNNIIDIKENKSKERLEKIRIKHGDDHLKSESIIRYSRSSSRSEFFKIYKDGILIPSSANIPNDIWNLSGPRALPIPRLVVNLKNSDLGTVNISRTELKDKNEHWSIPIYNAFLHYILNKYKNKLLAMDPIERAYELGRILVFHNISAESFWQMFPQSQWPFIFLESDGKIVGENWENILESRVNLFPLHDDTGTFMTLSKMSDRDFNELFAKWNGEKVLIQNIWNRFPDSIAGTTAKHLCDIPIKKNHFLGEIRFLQAPWEGDPPLLQRVLYSSVRKEPEKFKLVENILRHAVDDPDKLTPYETHLLNEFFNRSNLFNEIMLAESVKFPPPFANSFAFGSDFINLSHPCGKALVQFRAHIELSKIKKSLPDKDLGILIDALNDFNRIKKGIYFTWGQFQSSITKILSLVREFNLFDFEEFSTFVPEKEDFVPGTISIFSDKTIHFENNNLSSNMICKQYGTKLTSI